MAWNVLCLAAHKKGWIGPDDTDDAPPEPIDVYRNIDKPDFRTIVDYLSIKHANGICEMDQVSAIWVAKHKKCQSPRHLSSRSRL